MMKKTVALSLLMLFCTSLWAQVSPGMWSEHLSYYCTKSLALVDNKIYCAAAQGMFVFDQENQSITPFNKLKGLSDVDISVLRYAEDLHLMVIGYENGNIDLLNTSTSSVSNLPDLIHKNLNYSKRINNICVDNKLAYLACDFGILVINLEKKEIADTYYIGNLGSMVQVNDVRVFDKKIYAATIKGIYSCPLSSDFISDYHNWTQESVPYPSSQEPKALATLNDKLVACTSYGKADVNDNIFLLSDGVWTSCLFSLPAIKRMSNSNDKLAIFSRSKLLVLNKDGSVNLSFDKMDRGDNVITDVAIDKSGTLWFCDSIYALGKIKDKNFERLHPNCPRYSGLSHILANNANDVWVAGGGQANQWSGYGGYRYNNGIWKTFNYETYWPSIDVPNFYKVAISPYDPTHVFFCSWGYGVIEFQNDQFVQIYDERNTEMQAIYNSHAYLRMAGIAFDDQNNLWAVASNVDKLAYVKKNNSKTFEAVSLKFQGSFDQSIGDLMVTQGGTKWVILKKYGILAFDGKGNELKFAITDENGATVSNSPLCMAQDKDGAVWAGTDAGIAIYSSPENVFTKQKFVAYRPVVNNQYLLSSERVTSIAVDGANRKWVGTESSGVFLVSASGTEQIKHYTKDNSPLPSNQIVSLGINPQTGEVFIGTSNGLVSVGSDASSGKEDFSDIYSYPNPVRPGYEGDITIAGLMDNSNIKITDIAGNLVFETISQGGMATWNGKNMHGSKVSTGVYMIFCTNSDGSKSKVSKLLFVK